YSGCEQSLHHGHSRFPALFPINCQLTPRAPAKDGIPAVLRRLAFSSERAKSCLLRVPGLWLNCLPMKVLGIIPARFAPTRFPGKPLAVIAGKPLIQRVVEQCQKSTSLS